jgi:hypothetical protein
MLPSGRIGSGIGFALQLAETAYAGRVIYNNVHNQGLTAAAAWEIGTFALDGYDVFSNIGIGLGENSVSAARFDSISPFTNNSGWGFHTAEGNHVSRGNVDLSQQGRDRYLNRGGWGKNNRDLDEPLQLK